MEKLLNVNYATNRYALQIAIIHKYENGLITIEETLEELEEVCTEQELETWKKLFKQQQGYLLDWNDEC